MVAPTGDITSTPGSATPPRQGEDSRWADAWRLALITVAYAFALAIGLYLPGATGILAAVWPVSGIALAALLVSPKRQRWAILTVIGATCLVVNILSGRPALASVGFMVANVLEAWGCLWLLTRSGGNPVRFARVAEVLLLALCVVSVNSATALIGAATATFVSGAPFLDFYWTWWIADGLGILFVTPLVVTCAQPWRRVGVRHLMEAGALCLVWCIYLWFIFSRAAANLPIEPRPYWGFAPLVWAALRFGVRATTLLLTVTAMVVIGLTVAGQSLFPLGGDDAVSRLQMAQLFLGVLGFCGLVLAAASSERKQTEAALRESNKRLKDVTFSLADWVWEVNEKGVYTYSSQLGLNLFGSAPSGVIGKTPFDFMPPDEANRVRAIFADIAARKAPIKDLENWNITKNGERVCLLTNGVPILDEEGNLKGYRGVDKDITERKRADGILKTSEERFRKLFEDHSAVKLILEPETGKIIDANGAAVKFYGWTIEELRTKSIHEINTLSPLEVKSAMEKIQSFQQNHFEFRHRRADGSVCDVEVYSNKIESAGKIYLHSIIHDISERKRAEARLRESEERFRQLADNITAVFWITSPDFKVMHYVSPAYEQIWGRSAASLYAESKQWEEAILPEDRDQVRADLAGLFTDKPAMSVEYRIWRSDGALRWIHDQAFQVRDSAGKLIRLTGIATDITERKQADEALEQTRKTLVEAQRIAHLGSFKYVAATQTTEWSDEECRIYGLNPGGPSPAYDEMLAKHIHPDDAALLHEVFSKAIQDRSIYELEHRIVRPDGTVRWVIDRAMPYVDATGKLLSYIGTTLDITERKQAEEQLRKQVTLLDSANDAIYVRALDHTVTYWNVGAERLYGLSFQQVLGRKITELGGKDPAAFDAAHAKLLAEGSWAGELRKPNKDGKERIISCRWTLLRDEQGQPKEVLAINSDVTEQKQLEAQFLRAQRMEGIGMLAGGIAHDLNNILTPIVMSASLLRDVVRDAEDLAILDSVVTNARRGADIIRQLLTFARGQPGVRAPVPVRRLLREMDTFIRETFPRNLRLVVTVPPELWPVVGDTTQIHQAIMNLCVNARDAMPDGGTLTLAADNVTLDAASAARMPDIKPGPHVRLCVTDTGTGIAAEHLERIFDPFFTTKEIGKGTGLGLPTVLGIVRGHGGSVRVDSRVGQGTTFELYLPASPEAQAADAPERESQLPRGHGELILVVDDEATLRGAARNVLEKYGYRVQTACEGREALTLFDRHRSEIKAVVTDMMMPGMDGPKLVRALRQLEARLPILGMTGLIERGAFKGLEGLDSVPLLAKPFEVEKLLVALHQTLTAANPTNGPAT